MTPKPGKPINADSERLDAANAALTAMRTERDALIDAIRKSAHDAVIVFVDMVGSTKNKLDHADQPEVWIFRVRQFYQVLNQYVHALGGRLIKYIGDEVMAVFDGDTRTNDAASLIARVDDIQTHLTEITGEPCQIKVAVDCGPVYCIELPGHDEPDVLGTPVDRCARIGKYARPGVVLASYEFRMTCPPAYSWVLIGEPDLKGIGKTKVFQLGVKTFDIVEVVEVPKPHVDRLNGELERLREETQALAIKNQDLVGQNLRLQTAVEELGATPDPADCASDDDGESDEDAWEEIGVNIRKLKKLISGANVPSNQYARFLFLHMQGAGDVYDKFKDKVFDECIEAKLVDEDNNYYTLRTDHRRNEAAVQLMEELEGQLQHFNAHHREPDDLMEYSLSDPQFWEEKVGYSVRSW